MNRQLQISLGFLFFGLLAGRSVQGQVPGYIKIDGFKHPERHELSLRSNSKFQLKERNFKACWLTEGTWRISGDTLILTAKTRTMKRALGFRKKDKKEFVLVKKYFMVKGGLKSDKAAEEFAYYSVEEWKKRGKPTEILK